MARRPDTSAELEETRQYEQYSALLDDLRGLRWPARAAVRGGLAGAHTSRMRGSAAEFMEYRPYRQGDDPSRIDWKLFARSNRAFIRLSNDRAILPTTIVLDASASMDYPNKEPGKWELASRIAIGLATVARNGGDPVGLLIPLDDDPVRVAPGTRRTVLHEIMRGITGTRPRGSSPLAPVFSAATRGAGRLVVISDFLGDAGDTLSAAASAVAGSHEVHAIHIVARGELSPDGGLLLAADPELPEIRRPFPADARDAYVRAFTSWREQLEHDWSDAGVSFHSAVTEDDSADTVIRRIVAARAERRG